MSSATTTAVAAPSTMFKLKLIRENGKESVHRFSGIYSFPELDTVICHLWGGSRPKRGLLLTYFDNEGDPVNFCTQEEWDECLKLHHDASSSNNNTNNKGKLLRLGVQRADTPPPSPCQSDLSHSSAASSECSCTFSFSTTGTTSPLTQNNEKKLPLSFSELFHQQQQQVPPLQEGAVSAPGTQPPSPTSAPVFNSHVDPLALPPPPHRVTTNNSNVTTTTTEEDELLPESASVYADDVDSNNNNPDVEVVTDSFDFAELDGVQRVETGEEVEEHEQQMEEEEEEQGEDDAIFDYEEDEQEAYEDEHQFVYEDPSISDQLQLISDEMFTCRDAGKLDYLRACMSSIEDKKEEAIELLMYAWAQGFYDPHKLKTDPALENARAHPRFFTEVLPGGDAKEKMAAEQSLHPDERQAAKLKDEKVCNLLAMYPAVTTDGAAAALVAAGGDLQMACEILDGGNKSYSHIPSYTAATNNKSPAVKGATQPAKKVVGKDYRLGGCAGTTTEVVVKKEAQAPNAGKRIQYGGKKKKNLNRYAS